ncbi:VOC family protein [Halobium salinum]|uniref:VOC family protein n=1 Tax=Halobium salinum TaxID=1364940 RepID=A0ABD5PBP9_9EURY|nr:VOC family protein [Halobium salinum]
MSSDHDVYPMPLFPRLTVADVERSTDWYEALGFAVVFSMPGVVHLRYRKYADVMLVREDGPATDPRGTGVEVYLTLEDESVEDVAARAGAVGDDAEPPTPTETAWNTRELSVRDPDGYELVFSAVVDAERPFEDVMGGPADRS